MKNVLIVALVIGLAISLWFNWKGIGKAVNNEKYRSIELGKDSLVVEYYFQKPDSVSSPVSEKMPDVDIADEKSKAINRANILTFTGTYATKPGCMDCSAKEKDEDRNDDCSIISCIPDFRKQQAIVKGPEHTPVPWLILVGVNAYTKHAKNIK